MFLVLFIFSFALIVNNMRIILDRLAVSMEDLATHGTLFLLTIFSSHKGPLKPEETRGLTQ